MVAFLRGDIPLATRYAIDGLLETHRMRDVGTTTISLHIGVLLAMMLGRWEEGAAVHGAYEALCERRAAAAGRAGLFYATQDPFAATKEALAEATTRPPSNAAMADARRGGRAPVELARRSPDQPADRTCRSPRRRIVPA